nr:hypothetical protein Q903MT_gene3530 [Picea sitchensis]
MVVRMLVHMAMLWAKMLSSLPSLWSSKSLFISPRSSAF